MGQIENLTILLGQDSFKLNIMVADKEDSGWIGRIVWITEFFLCGQIFFFVFDTILCSLKESYFFGLIQTMPNPRSDHLYILHCRKAQMDKDGASKDKIILG